MDIEKILRTEILQMNKSPFHKDVYILEKLIPAVFIKFCNSNTNSAKNMVHELEILN